MASSSSSSLAPSAKYDVFLSFRGVDTRNNFTGHLYAALCRENVTTFIDDKVARGDEISPSLLNAIEGSNISAIIFSKSYASSRWCLQELEKIMECKKKYNRIVIPVFYNVARSDLIEQIQMLIKSEEDFKGKSEKVQGWRTALIEATNLPGFNSDADRYESILVEKVVKHILKVLNDKDLFIEQSTINEIESLLRIGFKDVSVIGIWGMSSIGKTTISKVVFDKIKYEFDNSYFAENVREELESPDGLTILRQELLFGILKDQYSNLGFNFIKQRLGFKKILIVFDDVTSLKQIKDLIGDFNYLGLGSRVIITASDQQVLEECGVDKSNMHEVKELCQVQALKLFSWHAFQQTCPYLDYSELSNKIVEHAKGAPLALKVLGSFLRGKKQEDWENAIKKLEGISQKGIQEVLRVSYDGLDDDEKNIFLDIACFLKGEDGALIIKFLNTSGFFAEIGVNDLLNKSLITFSNNKITMHDLLQEMGKKIVQEESSEDHCRQSRLWRHKDILEVLQDKPVDQGTGAVEAVCLDMSKIKEKGLNYHGFWKMHNLRFLKVYNKHFEENDSNKWHDSYRLEAVLTELRYLCWHGYPLKSLQPHFHLQNLVSLELTHSNVKQLWIGKQNLVNLKRINLSHSKKLIKSPNLSCTPNLESLILEGCASLLEISPSIECLNKLTILNLRQCDNLRRLPMGIPSESLKKVILSCCSNLKRCPDISCSTEELFLDETAIKELPPSIENLSGLVTLNLRNCSKLERLPSNIYKLTSLEHLNLSGCSKLYGLPGSLGNLEASLKDEGLAKSKVPSSIVDFGILMELNLTDCRINELPSALGHLPLLESLLLGRNSFESLPASIVHLSKLLFLDLSFCDRLKRLPKLPCQLQYIIAHSCASLEALLGVSIVLPSISTSTRVNFINCFKLDQRAHLLLLKDLLEIQKICPRLGAYICFPGTEIPEWFAYRSMESSINFNLESGGSNTRLVSFAVSAVVEFQNYRDKGQGLVVGCHCKFKGRDVKVALYYGILPDNVELKHVFLGYDPCMCSSDLDDNQCNANEVSIEFYVEDSNGKPIDCCKVKCCGVHLLYHQEIGNPRCEVPPVTDDEMVKAVEDDDEIVIPDDKEVEAVAEDKLPLPSSAPHASGPRAKLQQKDSNKNDSGKAVVAGASAKDDCVVTSDLKLDLPGGGGDEKIMTTVIDPEVLELLTATLKMKSELKKLKLHNLVKAPITKALTLKSELKKLESTLKSFVSASEQIKMSNGDLGLSGPERVYFEEKLKEAKRIVGKCSEVSGWNLIGSYYYAKKLQKLNGLILRFCREYEQAQMERAIGEAQSKVRSIFDGLRRSRSLCGSPPEYPKFLHELDIRSKEIKKDLLKPGGGVIVLSAPGGFGKTTLVQKLCKDEEVKAIFKDNIFYVTVSKTLDVKVIVNKIFEQKGNPVHKFQTDDEAINDLKQFLNEIGSKEILLVLDDVWLELKSISVLYKFESQLPDYKILVTSRYPFPQIGNGHTLKRLNEDTAMKFFRHLANLMDGNSYDPEIIEKIVTACRGCLLALTVVGRSLCEELEAIWVKRVKGLTKDATVFNENDKILDCLRSSLDVLDDKLLGCFMDLGSFPENQRIPVTSLIDMWRELYEMGEDFDVISNLSQLSNRSLLNLEVPRKDTCYDGCYNVYFVTQHSLLRELIILQNGLEPEEERKRIFIEIEGSKFPNWWLAKKRHPVKARLMSISTDEEFSSSWIDLKAPEVEVLVLHMQSEKYTLPNFLKEMNKMKVLIVTNNGLFPTELSNFQLLGLIPDLKRIRLEYVSIPSSDMPRMEMKNLQKISLVRCNIGEVFENSTFQISYTCPNLREIDIDYCNDLKNVPDDLCEIVSIMKLSITNCHNFRELPKGMGELKNLRVLRLASCTDLVALPDTIGRLSNLNLLDISECLEIKELPEQMGDLRSLKTLCMKGCSRCKLPASISMLTSLDVVKCDEETTYNWNRFKLGLPNLRIEKVEEDTSTFIKRLLSIGG